MNAKNPMKPDENAPNGFESEDVAKYAFEAAEEYGLDVDTIVGTGEEGVITADDVDAFIQAASASEDVIDFASDEAGEFYAENKEKIDLDKVEGTGKNGSITKGNLKKALEEQNPAPKDDKKEDTAPAAAATDDEPADDDELDLIEEFISFGLPVKGALRNKPKVMERWNDLIQRAIKYKQAN